MEAIVEQCCGSVPSGARRRLRPDRRTGAQGAQEYRTFGTITRNSEALRDWLTAESVTHVGWRAPTSTGGRCIRRSKAASS